MKAPILLCLLLTIVQAAIIEKEIKLGDGKTITVGFDDEELDNEEEEKLKEMESDTGNDNDEDEDDATDNGYDHGIEDYLDHDCENVRNFTVDEPVGLIPSHINRPYKYRSKHLIVKYNSAYGIPVFGKEHFTDAAMKRTCYLIRYLFAEHEGMRRMAYKGQMYVYGNSGGFMTKTSPDVGNAGTTCPCSLKVWPYIFTPAHEFAHWFLKFAFPNMVKYGYFKPPQFLNNDHWQYDEKFRPCCKTDGCENQNNKANKYTNNTFFAFLYNALQQDSKTPYSSDEFNIDEEKSTKIKVCNTHHYFIYTGQNKFLTLDSAGEVSRLKRKFLKERNPNLSNLLEMIWPCGNTYVSTCEDANYGFEKGIQQRLIIGKSENSTDRSQITCDTTIDAIKNPIEETRPQPVLSPIADTDLDNDLTFNKREDKFEYMAQKCDQVLRAGSWPMDPWLKEDETIWDLNVNPLLEQLKFSNDKAWWLRKCCATTAQFNNKLEQRRQDMENIEQDLKNEGVACWDECGKKKIFGHCPEFCGQDGYCCKLGEKTNGCDGMNGRRNLRVCVGKKYLFKQPDQ